jgi:hypothetical protein
MSGVARFMVGLQELGLEAEERGGLVVVTLDVGPASAPGPHQVGTDPPSDYPRVPPHWLHLRRGLVLGEDPGRASELGDDWWKWSRAHPKWKDSDSAARLWVAHARSLLLVAQVA